MKKLFQRPRIGQVQLKNSVVFPPMVCSVYREDGIVSAENIEHYREIAQGGVGLIIQEATCVSDTGKLSKTQLGIWEDGQVEGLKKITDAVHAEGGTIVVQIHHAGFKGVDGVYDCPSDFSYTNAKTGVTITGHEMSAQRIEKVIQQFIDAGKRAYQAGYDGIELHAAHAYLISQFFNTRVNKRTDRYGQEPALIAVEILEGIRQVTSSKFILGIRMGAFEPGLENSLSYAKTLAAHVDFLNISHGVFSFFEPFKPDDYPFEAHIYATKQIKAAVNVPVFVANNITTPQMAEEILMETGADMVNIGRGILVNHQWPNDAKAGRNTGLCLHCKRCAWHMGGAKCPGRQQFLKIAQ